MPIKEARSSLSATIYVLVTSQNSRRRCVLDFGNVDGLQSDPSQSLQIDVKEEVTVTSEMGSPSEYKNTTLESIQEV